MVAIYTSQLTEFEECCMSTIDSSCCCRSGCVLTGKAAHGGGSRTQQPGDSMLCNITTGDAQGKRQLSVLVK